MSRLIKTIIVAALALSAGDSFAAEPRVGSFSAVSPDGLNELRL